MREKFDLTGRVALITGAGSIGIGSGCARILARFGAKVFLTDCHENRLPQICAEIEETGGEAAWFIADVSSEEDCKASVEACVERFGRLDIMVLSAGIAGRSAGGGRDFEAIFDSENWRKVQGINLDGVFFMMKHGYEECAKHGVGAIVPISSVAAYRAAGAAAYTATKGAIRSLTHYFGRYFGPLGVRVNTVYPDFIVTDMNRVYCEDAERVQPIIDITPLGCLGQPEDVGYAVLYFVSDASGYVTGQHLCLDGGRML